MKLRIRDNSIRLRLQRAEVARLHEQGCVTGTLQLGAGPGDVFLYQLETHAAAQPRVCRDGVGIMVRIPESWAAELVATDRTGFDFNVEPAPGVTVRVTVEKDFQCLVERPGEDDADGYDHPNPAACS